MTLARQPLTPLKPAFKLRMTTEEQLKQLQNATFNILESVGVRFPSKTALQVFADHGALVDWNTQVVKMSPDFVLKALSSVPRFFCLGGREPSLDLKLQDGTTYFTTDGCGVETVDVFTGKRRPSCKEDVAMMAKISDYLSSIAFYWPMVSAQDYGKIAPLHELDASWNNTLKHVQSETLMGAIPVRYALEMATVIAGSNETIRQRPPFSLVLCTIAPLMQDKEGIEGAMLLAEAGIPVGFLAMPTLGTTAPATLAGALVIGDAEIISGAVLLQLVAPGAPVFHSIMHAWADPRNANYIGYPLDSHARYVPVDMAHHWNMPAFGGAYGTESHQTATWQAAADVALDPFLVALSGAEFVTGMGLVKTYTLLYPEQIILDSDLYHRARYAMINIEVNQEELALDVIREVGPGGNFLKQKHTRKHMPPAVKRSIAHQFDNEGKYLDPHQAAIKEVREILANYQPDRLEMEKQRELNRILKAADQEIK
jgi:trimethylamine--corrinoid protein Co-methyltransferase